MLERAYADIREAERRLDPDRLSPEAAVRRLAGFTFDYHKAHPGFEGSRRPDPGRVLSANRHVHMLSQVIWYRRLGGSR